MITTVYALFSAIGGLLYRLGGYGLPFNTKVRDLGIPTLSVLYLILIRGWHWTLIPYFLLLFGALSYSFKKKGTEMRWWNYVFMGLGYSISVFPYIILTHNVVGFTTRVVLVTLLTMISSVNIGDDDLEEFCRGYILVASLPVIL